MPRSKAGSTENLWNDGLSKFPASIVEYRFSPAPSPGAYMVNSLDRCWAAKYDAAPQSSSCGQPVTDLSLGLCADHLEQLRSPS